MYAFDKASNTSEVSCSKSSNNSEVLLPINDNHFELILAHNILRNILPSSLANARTGVIASFI